MNKRLWALLTALALLLPGCGGGGGENRPEIRVGLALYKEDDTFIEAITEGIHRAAAESSREGTWRASISVADAEGSQISQNQQIERFLSLGYDVLCVNLVDRTNAAPIIDKAMEADIPIVFFNREPVPEDMEKWDRLCYVGSDARQSAELEAQIILDLWEREPQALDRNGDGVIQYIMMEGERRHQDTVIRTEGTIQALRDGGLELERLDSGIANWDRTQAQALMAGYLDQYGGQVELVICNNDDMALGVADGGGGQFGFSQHCGDRRHSCRSNRSVPRKAPGNRGHAARDPWQNGFPSGHGTGLWKNSVRDGRAGPGPVCSRPHGNFISF